MELLKVCSKCDELMDQGSTMCAKCSDKNKSRHTDYDKTKRNKESAKIYNSKRWRDVRHKVKVRDMYMCMVCFHDKTRVKSVHTVHHIIPIEDDIKGLLIYDPANLICVCQACHLQIHTAYDKNKFEKELIQNKLFEIISKRVGDGV